MNEQYYKILSLYRKIGFWFLFKKFGSFYWSIFFLLILVLGVISLGLLFGNGVVTQICSGVLCVSYTLFQIYYIDKRAKAYFGLSKESFIRYEGSYWRAIPKLVNY